jgi:crotonobetainyl-CoA:carnitine CoA-transferase CaiB-like acyl-CoA transferase
MDAIPAVGAQTDAILEELGFDASTIKRMRAAKAI